MSERPPPAQQDSSPGAPTARRPRRWVDTLTALLVCVAVGIIAFTLAPEVLRASGVGGPGHEVGSHPGGRITLLPHGGETPSHPLFGPDDDDEDEPRKTELERLYPEGMWPGRRSPEERRRDQEIFPKPGAPRDAPEQGGPRVHERGGPPAGAGEARARFGVVRRRITLVDDPVGAGRELGHVDSGKLVMVIKEVGDFALVAYSGDDGVLMGWTKKSEIAVR